MDEHGRTLTGKPAQLRMAELALVAAWRRYDALDKAATDAWQRIRRGEAYCREHPQDRHAVAQLSKLRMLERVAWPDVLRAIGVYDQAHGDDGAEWPLEAESAAYFAERAAYFEERAA